MRLTNQQIQDILASKNLTCSNLNEYKNMDTILKLKCKQGHEIEASIRTIRNANFKCSICEGEESVDNSSTLFSLPKKQGKRIVAIDNATENVGIAVFDDSKFVFCHLYTYSGETIDRMVKNRTFLEDVIIKTWEPDIIVFEDIQYQTNILTFKTLAMLLGSSIVATRKAKVRYETVLSKVWRSHFMITGKTRIQQKKQAIDKVKLMYNIDVNDDVAEAILIGKYSVDKLKDNARKKLF